MAGGLIGAWSRKVSRWQELLLKTLQKGGKGCQKVKLVLAFLRGMLIMTKCV